MLLYEENKHLSEFFLCAFQQVKKLQAILKPMMLRRLKDDVEKNLAPKEETIIEVECVFERNCYHFNYLISKGWDYNDTIKSLGSDC